MCARGMRGRPTLPDRDLRRHIALKPLRCHPSTVAGLTMTRGRVQSAQSLRRTTQKIRSPALSRARFLVRRPAASCWRRAAFSKASVACGISAARARASRADSSVRIIGQQYHRWGSATGTEGYEAFADHAQQHRVIYMVRQSAKPTNGSVTLTFTQCDRYRSAEYLDPTRSWLPVSGRAAVRRTTSGMHLDWPTSCGSARSRHGFTRGSGSSDSCGS